MRGACARGGRVLLLLLVLAVPSLLAACLADPAPPVADDGPPLIPTDPPTDPAGAARTLRWAIGEPGAIVPPLVADEDGLRVADALFEGLTRLDEDLRPRPGAALEWSSDDRGVVWTFHLDPSATFHDGSPVTAQDVRFSWEEGIRQGRVAPHLTDVLGYSEFVAGDEGSLPGLRVLGEHTLQVVLSRPRADLPVVVAHPSLAPVPEARYRADPEGFAEEPIGNGPFAMAEAWAHDSFIRLRPVPGEARLDEVLFRITDPTTAYIAFQQGRIDVTTVPAGALQEAVDRHGEGADGRRGPGLLRGESAEVYLLGMDTTSAPFDVPAVRRALSFAIDREALAGLVPDGNATPARGVVPHPLPGSQVAPCATCLHAPTAASRLFEEAGISQLTLWIDRDGGHDEVAEELRRQLAEVGVQLDIVRPPLEAFLDAVDTGRAGLFRYGWVAEHPHAEDMLVPLLHSSSAGVASGNPGRYANGDVDALLDEALGTLEGAERRQLLRQAETLAIGREQALVPLLVMRHRLVVSDRVEGFVLQPTGRADLGPVSLVEEQGPGDA